MKLKALLNENWKKTVHMNCHVYDETRKLMCWCVKNKNCKVEESQSLRQSHTDTTLCNIANIDEGKCKIFEIAQSFNNETRLYKRSVTSCKIVYILGEVGKAHWPQILILLQFHSIHIHTLDWNSTVRENIFIIFVEIENV